MDRIVKPYREMHYSDNRGSLFLNQCCFCRRFREPFVVGRCEYTPEFSLIDHCEYYTEINASEVLNRLDRMFEDSDCKMNSN